ncbi:hypothetical protein ACHAXR_007517 [Thalassiosira sp. AJA248-18]
MGKKRNNATKKKQAAKKKKLSSAYGVSVLKGGTIARNNGVLDTNCDADGNPQTKKQIGASSKGSANSTQPHSNGSGNNGTTSTHDTGKRSHTSRNENDEFKRMHDSLEERSLALQARTDDQRRSKKARQKHTKKGWGKFARPSTTNFAPATLTLAPKTTQELMDDAADQVAQGMVEIGQRTSIPLDGLAPTVPGQSSLAAAASLSWKLRVSNVSNQVQQPQNQNNSFAAFHEDSDSDNDWSDKKTKPIQQFQFQPASFSFQPAISNPSVEVAAGADDDVDPDL